MEGLAAVVVAVLSEDAVVDDDVAVEDASFGLVVPFAYASSFFCSPSSSSVNVGGDALYPFFFFGADAPLEEEGPPTSVPFEAICTTISAGPSPNPPIDAASATMLCTCLESDA